MDSTTGNSKTSKKGPKWTRILAVASSIVGIIAFGMFVTTYIIQKRIEATQKRQQEAFLNAVANFTNLLDSKNQQLQTLSSRLSTLDRLKAQVDRIHERVVRRRSTGNTQQEDVQNESNTRQRIANIYDQA